MTARPLIAVIGRRAPSVDILRFSATVAAEAMCEAVYAAGGEPAVFHGPARRTVAGLGERLSAFGGVLLPGGADLSPERYGQERAPETEEPSAFQDAFDLAVASCVVELGLPTLAVCRGMQVLNVALGGSLVQHLSESSVGHRNGHHEVAPVPGTRLHQVVGAHRFTVSSYHHQAVDRLGEGLVVTAVSDDGCIEALEHHHANVIAVQWHPEDLHATSRHDAALFDDLVARAREREEAAA